ncbi:MAG: class I SAM-dependent methyltransferase [Myxococcales bacterium]
MDLERAREVGYAGYAEWKGWLKGEHSHLSDAHDSFRRELLGIEVSGRRVHELGFGDGHFLDWAKSQRAETSGVELDAALVAAARERGHDAAIVAPGGSIGPLSPGSIDVIVALDVLEHLAKHEIATVLAEASRALRVGGHIVARFPNGASPFSGLYQHGDATHATQLTADALGQLSRAHSFNVMSVRNAARPLSGRLRKRLLRTVRYGVQSSIGAALSVVYFGRLVPLDPNVTVVLTRA